MIKLVVMESNRDEADKCLELAMKYVRQGNKEKAERFVRKAEKLFPSRRIQEVLNLVEQMGEEEVEGSRGERERSAEQSHDNEEASTSSLPKNFTQEQVGRDKHLGLAEQNAQFPGGGGETCEKM